MKTVEELVNAMRAIADEASKSGFTFCAAITHNGTPVTCIFCGESLLILGLAEVIKLNVNEKNKVV